MEGRITDNTERLNGMEATLKAQTTRKVIKQIKNEINEVTKLRKQEEKNMATVMSKISKHKWKLAIIIAETILWMAGAYGRYLLEKFGKTSEGDLIWEIVGIANIGLAMLSAYIFGNKTELDDKVGLIRSLELKNQYQHFIITDRKLTDPGWKSIEPEKVTNA